MGILKFFKRAHKTTEQSLLVRPLDDQRMRTNLKNLYTEMWILACLSGRAMTVFEMLKILEEKSDGVFKITYPVVTIYSLKNNHCIKELAHDNSYRRFEITDSGREYFSKLRQCHELFAQKNNTILKSIETGQAV